MSLLHKLAQIYADKFGDSPPLIGLPADKQEAAMLAMANAVLNDIAFASDAAFFEAVGLHEIPDGALL